MTPRTINRGRGNVGPAAVDGEGDAQDSRTYQMRHAIISINVAVPHDAWSPQNGRDGASRHQVEASAPSTVQRPIGSSEAAGSAMNVITKAYLQPYTISSDSALIPSRTAHLLHLL